MRSLLNFIFVVGLAVLQNSIASASITVGDQKVSLGSGDYRAAVHQLAKLNKGDGKDSIAFCAEVVEIPGAIVCAFKRSSQMNASLVRTSFSVLGSQQTYVIPQNDPLLKQYVGEVGGQTVKSDTLRNFFSAALVTTDPNRRMNGYEYEIYTTFVTNPAFSNLQFAVVAIALDGVGPEIILSHEINHARMYLNSIYSQKINSFWTNAISEKDKQRIRNDLRSFYGTNESTIIDEFQAYCLEIPNDQNPLEGLVSKYRKSLLTYLAQ